jgi:hypothetical protein
MLPMLVRKDLLGMLSSSTFAISVGIFSYVARHVLFGYPKWDYAFGGTALVGFVLAMAGIIYGIIVKRLPIFSIVGAALNIAPAWFMFLVFSLGSMH